MPTVLEELLSDDELSPIVGRSKPTLQKDRLKGIGPPYLKIGRLVRYRPSAVQAWLDDQVRRSTSDPGEPARTTSEHRARMASPPEPQKPSPEKLAAMVEGSRRYNADRVAARKATEAG